MSEPESMVEDVHSLRPSDLLQQFLNLGVVLILDEVIVREVLLDTRPMHELEPVLVQRELGLASAHVVDDGWVRVRPDIGAGFTSRGLHVVAWRLVVEGLEIVQRRGDVAGSEDSGGGHCVEAKVVRKLGVR